MGIKINPPEYGNDCAHCWDPGETPEFIYVMFEGVKKGDVVGSQIPPNGHIFKCIQDPAAPCIFNYNKAGAGWQVEFARAAGTGRWHMKLWHDGHSHFTGWLPDCPEEHDIWTNLLWTPIFHPGYDGVATVFWLDEARTLMAAMNIPDESGTFMEFFLKDESDPVYKFCNTRYGINHTILVPP